MGVTKHVQRDKHSTWTTWAYVSTSAGFQEDSLLFQDPELPEGWEARKNKDGRSYYVDHERRITTWEHPLEAAKKAEEREKLGSLSVSRGGWCEVRNGGV